MFQLFQLASNCAVVLCCRVAPLQKAGIVALIKNRTDDMTLAIGDGKHYFCASDMRHLLKTISTITSFLVVVLYHLKVAKGLGGQVG